MSTVEPLITSAELAKRLGVSVSWIVRRQKDGRIPAYKLGTGGPARYRWSEIEEWLNESRTTRMGREAT